jgi:hypothetical protein
MSMLKPLQPDPTEQDLGSLGSSRNALLFLYEESLGNGNADITQILREALACGDRLIAEGQDISYESKDALFCLFFLRAILGLNPKKVRHLVELLEWLKIVPRDGATSKSGDSRKRPKAE